MSRSEPDATSVVRLWLEEGATVLPDRVLDAVLDQLPATPQRRPTWLARRLPTMNNTVRLALAAAAVVVAALLGYQFLIAPNVGGPGPAPVETPTPTPQPSPTTASAAGALTPGTTYRLSSGGVPFTFSVPVAGWEANEFGQLIGHPGSDGEAQVWLAVSDFPPGVFADPCAHQDMATYDATVAGYTEAFSSIPGTEVVSDGADAAIDGHFGQTASILIPEDIGCENSEFWLLFDTGCPTVNLSCTTFPTWLGESMVAWYVELNGSVFGVTAEVRYPAAAAGAEIATEIQQIVDSIQFE